MLARILGHESLTHMVCAFASDRLAGRTVEERAVLGNFRRFNAESSLRVSEGEIKLGLEKIVRGDLQPLEARPGFMTWSRWLSFWIPVVASQNIVSSNAQLCRPLVREICETPLKSIADSIKTYEKFRLISGITFPEWIANALAPQIEDLSEALRNLKKGSSFSEQERRDLFLSASPITFFPPAIAHLGLLEESGIEFERFLIRRLEKEGFSGSTLSRVEFDMIAT